MALTKDDLVQIEKVMDQSIAKAHLVTREEVKAAMDRMEGRLVSAMNLLQRDTFARLDDHESRLERLERAIIK